MFTLINIRAKVNEYIFYDSIVNEIKNKCTAENSICEFFTTYVVDDRIFITMTVHVLAIIGVLILCYKTWFFENES